MARNRLGLKNLYYLFRPEADVMFRLAVPIIIAQLGVVLMGVSDTIMIGRMLGKEPLAAAGLATSVGFVIASIAIGGLPVIAPIIAKNRASGQTEELGKIFRASIALATRFAWGTAFLSAIIYFNFNLLGQAKAIETLSKPFFIIICVSNLAIFYFVAVKQAFDGFSNPKPAMYITFGGLLANVFFNYFFIKAFGLNGAAYSTLMVRLLMLLALLIYFLRTKSVSGHFLKKQLGKHAFMSYTNQFTQLSILSGLQFFFEIGAFASALVMMGWIGPNALAAHQIAINIAATTYMMASGLAFAGGIRVGDALGTKSRKQIKLAGSTAFLLVFIFMFICMVAIYLLKHELISLYIRDSAIEVLAEKLLIVAAIFQLSDGLQVVALGNLRGLADVKIPAYVTFIAYWVIALPIGYFLAFQTQLSAVGIWIALLIGLSIAALLLIYRFYNLTRRLHIGDYSHTIG